MSTWAGLADELEARGARHRHYDDPVAFVEESVKWRPGEGLTAYQRETLAAIPARRRVSVRGPHGLGKTTISAFAVLWFACTREVSGVDWKCLTTAGSWRQLSAYLWPEVRKWSRRLDWDAVGCRPWNERDELLALQLRLRNGQAFAAASDRHELLEGLHADSVLYVFDESKAIAAATFDAAEGALGGQGEAYALAMSTPGDVSGRFYEIHARKPGLEDWHARHVTVDEAIEAGRVSRSWVEQRRKQWGGTSALFANRVLGEFAASDQDSVIPLAWVEAANERWLAWREAGGIEEGATSLGVDVARSGADKTVIAVLVGDVVVEIRRASHRDTMSTTGTVAGMVRARPGAKPVVDVIGVGGGVVDRLRELRLPVVAFNASESTDRKDRSGELGFLNKRAAAWWALRDMLDPANDATLALPPEDTLTGDLVAPKWHVASSGRIQVESKDEIRRRIGRSTDDADAVVMAAWMRGGAGQGAVWLAYVKERVTGLQSAGRNGLPLNMPAAGFHGERHK